MATYRRSEAGLSNANGLEQLISFAAKPDPSSCAPARADRSAGRQERRHKRTHKPRVREAGIGLKGERQF